MLSDLLRNLTFNRSAHCIQVSDQCPLGLLFQNCPVLEFLQVWSHTGYNYRFKVHKISSSSKIIRILYSYNDEEFKESLF